MEPGLPPVLAGGSGTPPWQLAQLGSLGCTKAGGGGSGAGVASEPGVDGGWALSVPGPVEGVGAGEVMPGWHRAQF